MTQTYRCIEGDILDRICWKFYGRTSGTVEAVLEANPGLADLGPVYSAGLKIELPSLPDAEATNNVIKLWD